jgi:hypothetical protein
MKKGTFRRTVRKFNLFLSGGMTTTPDPVYGRFARGNVESGYNRGDQDSRIRPQSSAEPVVKLLVYDLDKRRYHEERPRGDDR